MGEASQKEMFRSKKEIRENVGEDQKMAKRALRSTKIEKLSSYRDIVYSGLGAASEGPDLTYVCLRRTD